MVQEAYLRFSNVSAEAGTHAIKQPVAYLYRIVRNLAVDWSRHMMVESTDAVPDFDDVQANRASPEHEVLYREQLRLVADALNELPERARTAFEMHRLGGHSFLEISKRLHISVGLAHQLVRDVMAHCALRVERGQF